IFGDLKKNPLEPPGFLPGGSMCNQASRRGTVAPELSAPGPCRKFYRYWAHLDWFRGWYWGNCLAESRRNWQCKKVSLLGTGWLGIQECACFLSQCRRSFSTHSSSPGYGRLKTPFHVS